MIKATYKRNFTGVTVSEDKNPPWPSKSMAAGTAENSGRDLRARGRDITQEEWSFETAKPTPRDTPPPTRPHLLVLPKQFHQLGTKIKHMSLWEPFSFNCHTKNLALPKEGSLQAAESEQ